MRATWHTAIRSVAGKVRRALLSPGQLVLLAVVFLFSLLLASALSVPLKLNVSPAETSAITSPAAVASSFVLGLFLLCICLSLLPDGPSCTRGAHWEHVCVWLQMVDLAAVGYLGIWLAPGSGLKLGMLIILATITCAYAAALCGIHAVLCVVRRRPSYGIRAGLLVLLALAITAVLWTKTPLQSLQRQGERGVMAYNMGTQLVASLSPVLGWSASWKISETGFDLTKTTHTYQLWLGPSFISPPGLWPGRSGLTAEDRGPWGLGLIVGLMLWGLVLSFAGDLARSQMSPETPETP